MADYGVEDLPCLCTSAFREIVNPRSIIEQIYQRTGIQVEILSNAEQHFLGYKSIAAIEIRLQKIIQKGTASWMLEVETCRFHYLTRMHWC